MSESVTVLYEHAQVALGVYANLPEGTSFDRYVALLKLAGMGDAQARAFASEYRVIEQYDGKVVRSYVDEFGNAHQVSIRTGLSVTLFERVADGHRVVAIRGTEMSDLRDLENDLLLLFGGSAVLPQQAALTAKVQAWLDSGQLSPGFTVTGHSLGGFLATGLTATFGARIAKVYAYNAPGIGGILGDGVATGLPLDRLRALLQQLLVSMSGVDASKVINVRALPGISPVAGLGASVGTRVDVLMEEQAFSSAAPKELALNHSQATLTEALAVFDLLARLKPSLQMAEGADILWAASDNDAGMLEGVINPLLELFGKASVATKNATRDQLYQAIVDLYAHLPRPGQTSTLMLEALAGKSVSALRSLGETDVAFRYALKELNPFAVSGADYSLFDRGGALSMFDPATGAGAITGEWVRDRGELLYWHLVRNRDDIPGIVPNPGGEALQLVDRKVVGDKTVEERIRVGVSMSPPRTLAFGSERADEWSGSGYADGLYGGAGDDRLEGLGGADYLQGDAGIDVLQGGAGNDMLVGGKDADALFGGAGSDLYRWRKGDGTDYVIDFAGDGFGGDGAGRVEFLGTLLTGSLALADQNTSERLYTGPGALTYTLAGAFSGRGILTIAKPDEPGSISIVGFRSGELGLTLDAATPIEKSFQAGTLDADTLWSAGEREQVSGFDGNDRVTLLHGYTEGHGGAGHDYINDGIGDQTLYGDAGLDILLASQGADQLFGGDEADALQGGGDDDYLVAGAGDDVADGGAGSDVIEGGDGNDFLLGGGDLMPGFTWSPTGDPPAFGALVVSGKITGVQGMVGLFNADGDSADMIDGGAGDDTVLAGDGPDFVRGGIGADYLVGQVGNDALNGDEGDDVLLGDGTEGQLVIAGASYYVRPEAHGNDLLVGGLGNDHLEGDGGADQLYGNEGDDSLDGDSGWLDAAYHGEDYLDGGEGNDWVTGSGGHDTLYGGAGDDWMQGDSALVPSARKADDLLFGGEGADRMVGDGGADRLFGEAGDDFLFGDADDNDVAYDGADVLDGGEGNDYLRGHGGDDVLIGGAGNDQLLGDGDGARAGEAGGDTLIGGRGFDLMDGGRGDDRYELNIGDGIDKIFDGSGINSVVFGTGVAASAITVQQGRDESGTYAVISYGTSDVLAVENGFTGGIHFYRFADGTVLTPTELTRRLGRAQYAPLVGGTGADTLASTDLLEVLEGGAGSDVYLFGAASGVDIVVEGGGEDTLRFDPSVAATEATYSRASNGDLVVTVAGGAEVRVEGHYLAPERRVETIAFADGTMLDTATLDALAIAPIAGSAGDDWLTGSDFADTLEGGPGRDTLMGGEDADTYVFRRGDGEDTIVDGGGTTGRSVSNRLQLMGFGRGELTLERTVQGTLTIRSTVSNDAITLPDFYDVANRIETIELFANPAADLPDDRIQLWELAALPTLPVFGTDAADTLTGSDAADTLMGEGGNDVIIGLARDDLLFGGTGDDRLDGGAGEDALFGGSGADEFAGGAGQDRFADAHLVDGDAIVDIERGEVIVLADVGEPSALIASSAVRDGAAGVRIQADAADGSGLFVQGGLTQLDALDPTFELRDGTRMSYAALMERVFTTDATLIGTPIGDALEGYAGNDTLRGLGGEDRLIGGAGEDLLEGGDGNDELIGGTGRDTLRGGAGDDRYTIDATDILEEAPGAGVDTLVADFSAVLGANLEVLTLVGTDVIDAIGHAGANTLAGNAAANLLSGLGGDDTLLGNAGNDVLVGGIGDDLLAGGAGDDEYVLSVGDGMDTLEDRAGANVVSFGVGIAASGLVVSTHVGDDGATYLALAYGDSGDVLAIRDGLLGAVSAYRFADGGVLTHQGLLDTLGSLAIDGSAANDRSLGGASADTLDGRAGDDILHGGAGDDLLRGGAGRDILHGEDGQDTLDGGTGVDVLIGGGGEDTYTLSWGSGVDRIEEDGLDASYLRLGPAIGFDDLVGRCDGNDLTLALRGTGDTAITIADYFDSGAQWSVVSAAGETRLLADVLEASPWVPADPIAAAVAAFELRIKAEYFASLGAVGFAADGADELRSSSTLFSENGAHTTYSSYAIRTVRQVSDAPSIQRRSACFESDTQTESSTSELRVVTTSPGSRGVAKALAQTGNSWRFVPASAIAPAVTMSGTAIAVSRGGGDYATVQQSALQGIWVPEASGTVELPPLPTPVQRVIRITNSVTHESARLNIEEIRGGANSSSIGARDYTVVDAGAGDDFVYVYGDPGYVLGDTSRGYGRLGSLLFGNDGDDALAGSAGNDTLIGGAGDDSLSGDAGADTYAGVGEGSDSITDTGEDLDRYRQSYFNVANFSDLEVREMGGGAYLDRVAFAQYGLGSGEVRIFFGSPQEGLEWVLQSPKYWLERSRGEYASLLAWDGTGAPPTYGGQTAHDVRKEIERYEAEIAWEESRYLERFVYVEPLPPLPVIAGNDHAAIEPYYDSAVWVDRVALAQKWRADELIVSTSEVDGESGLLHLDHPDGDRVTITLARSADPIGTGIEVIGFADGTELTIQQVLARAIATGNLAGRDGYDELLGGPDAEVLAGRGGDDYLEGGGGHDTLLGGAGADTLRGGAGNDTYYLSAGDTATERSGQGVDTVYADVTWTLGRNFENLTLTGTDDIGATGNGFANVLTGNAGSNWLDGKGGGDTMAGGYGDDTYVVAQGADVVIENIDQGIDTVMASIGYTLGENLENLTLTGARTIHGTGNALANALTGNGARNKLSGGAGNDRLAGLGGNDTLLGGAGDDTYLLGRGDGTDTLVEHEGESDSAVFRDGIAADQIWLRRIKNDLQASVIGSTDAFVLRDWYRGSAHRIERFQTSDGNKTLREANVQPLVDAMAAFAPPPPGTTTLPLDYHTALAPIFAANWL